MPRFQGDLPERTYRLALSVLSLADQSPNNVKGWEIARQLIRAGTSIGANVHEANGALTDREFAQICNIARKEAMEVHFWLRLTRDHQLLRGSTVDQTMTEVEEVVKVLSTIVRKCRARLPSRST